MTRESATLTTLLFYMATLIAIGWVAHRRTRTPVDFYLAGRSLGPTVAAISAAASSSSVWTLLGVSGAAYTFGLSSLWLFPGCVGGFALNWYVVARPLRNWSHQRGVVTITEIIAGPKNRPLNRTISTICALIVLVCLGAYVAAQFQGAGKTFNQTFDWSLTHSILLASGIVMAYTLLGGFWAVSLTDTLQGMIMMLAAIAVPATALIGVGGPFGLVEGLRQIDAPGYMSLTRNLPAASALGFIMGLLGIGIGYPGQPHVVNRLMALKKGEHTLRKARRIAIVWAMTVFAGMLLLGLSGRVMFPDLQDPEVIFLTVTNAYMHPVAAGILIAAVVSAIMSTADSQLLVAGSAVTNDLRLGGNSPKTLLLRSRIVVVVISGCAVMAALLGNRQIFSQVLFAFSAMGSAFGPVLLVTLMAGEVKPHHTLLSILCGFGLSTIAFFLFPAPETKGLERVVPFLFALLIAWGGREKSDNKA